MLFAVIAMTMSVSCEDDGGSSVIPLQEGAVPSMVKSASGETIIDLIKLNNNEPVTLEFSAEVAQGNPESTDIVGIYTTVDGDVYNTILSSNVTLPQDFTLTVDDVVAAFSELGSTADIQLGDVLSVTTRFTLSDGTVLDIVSTDGVTGGTGTNLATTVLFTTVINYPVSCPTSLEGNYTGTVIATNQPAGTFISPQQITITQPAAGTYVLSDGTAGLFGAATPIGLQFTDVCGTLTVATPSTNFGGQVDFVQGDGTNLNPDTGVITLDLGFTATSCCGLPGIEYTLELVPN